MNLDNRIKYILLNKNLIKILNLNKKKNIILYDAVDVRDFKNLHNDKIKNSCVYAGSFAKGKGLEIIEKIAKVSPKMQFHLYGNKNTLYKSTDNYPNNIKFKGYVSYSKLTKVLPKYKVLLMPYEKEVGVLMKKINVVSYFSPLKLFEYMATGSCILASKLKVYQNILKHNQNSILIEHSDINTWSKNIFKVLNSNVNKIGKKAKIDANKYTWLKRAKNIISFYEN